MSACRQGDLCGGGLPDLKKAALENRAHPPGTFLLAPLALASSAEGSLVAVTSPRCPLVDTDHLPFCLFIIQL